MKTVYYVDYNTEEELFSSTTDYYPSLNKFVYSNDELNAKLYEVVSIANSINGEEMTVWVESYNKEEQNSTHSEQLKKVANYLMIILIILIVLLIMKC